GPGTGPRTGPSRKAVVASSVVPPEGVYSQVIPGGAKPQAAVPPSPLAPWGRGAGGEGAVCARRAMQSIPPHPRPLSPQGRGEQEKQAVLSGPRRRQLWTCPSGSS